MPTTRWSGIPGRNASGTPFEGGICSWCGVDSILSKLKAHPEMLPEDIPLFRLEDTGMGQQMQEYAVSRAALVPLFRRLSGV